MSDDRFTHLTFDCYGTLVDWERGILQAAGRAIGSRAGPSDAAAILELYARHEAAEEARPYRTYRQILKAVLAGIARDLGADPPPPRALEEFAASVGRWPPYPDTVEALRRLKARHRLVILSNVDDDLFRETARMLEVPFDEVITAQQVGAYKPSAAMFRAALERLGVPRGRILHVAQSLYHDHAPAKALGLRTAWIHRPSLRGDAGLAPPADAAPDMKFPDLRSLADALGS